jgi:hypothetical protein
VGAKCWDQIAVFDPEHRKNVKLGYQKMGSEGANNPVSGNKCTGFLPWGESTGGLFIRVVSGSVNNV